MEKSRDGDAAWSVIREEFENEKKIYDSSVLTFNGIDSKLDVYNCSIPFISGGKKYIFGRVEPHDAWASSHTYLFCETAPDVYDRVKEFDRLELEDPFIAIIGGELILGGVHVVKTSGEPVSYSTYFYRGTSPEDLKYFTTGPAMMKDIRLVEMPNGIGIFSRPNGFIGFTEIKNLDELDEKVINNAEIIDLIENHGYGGCNQCYYLDSGLIGIIGHMVYPKTIPDGRTERVYVNIAAVFEPEKRKTLMNKIIGTRRCYPASDRIRICCDGVPLDDTAFTSGLVMRNDGRADIYSGLSDALEGRITVDYPFENFGKIVYGGNKL